MAVVARLGFALKRCNYFHEMVRKRFYRNFFRFFFFFFFHTFVEWPIIK